MAMISPAANQFLTPAGERRRAIVACLIGNLFEIFDFTVYGYFAVEIGKAIFPSKDPLISILASFATYGVGFVMRPVGAMVLGSYGDRRGRKAALSLTISLMALATGLTGLVPSYASVGVWSPLMLVICRLLQGFSTGGEWGGATAFLFEFAPPGKRGLYGGYQQVSTGLAQISAVGTALAAHTYLSSGFLLAWGWRIPFLFGMLMAPVGYYLRSRVAESPAFEAVARDHQRLAAPLRAALGPHRRAVLTCFGMSTVWTIASYVFITFMPTFAVQTLHMNAGDALRGALCASLANVIIVPLAGAWSDRIGRLLPLRISALGFLLLAIPMFLVLVKTPTPLVLTLVSLLAGVLYGLYNGVAPAALSELFPTNVRYTALSVGYNSAVMVFGGFAPFTCTYLIRMTGRPEAPSIYVVGCAFISLFVLLAGFRSQRNLPV
jgi:MHS family proline/betaine transporter-like MFS transporter